MTNPKQATHPEHHPPPNTKPKPHATAILSAKNTKRNHA